MKYNNNWPYCYQKDDVKTKNNILNFDETVKIVSWLKQDFNSVVIFGKEPLLHTEIIKIMKYTSNELCISKLITNLITEKTDKIIQLSLR